MSPEIPLGPLRHTRTCPLRFHWARWDIQGHVLREALARWDIQGHVPRETWARWDKQGHVPEIPLGPVGHTRTCPRDSTGPGGTYKDMSPEIPPSLSCTCLEMLEHNSANTSYKRVINRLTFLVLNMCDILAPSDIISNLFAPSALSMFTI
ncbi:hypothetical protein DPMN_107165 [Dreissena polymorpha]|uniref:Uncharacterized protein n=1 Tax=Dreissena polymorpha TaxID=45954 RepID=A0A9D4QJW4_DREPO|nr:hypothetical protein DPMN_107165 [Dreissena polymorpha]